MMPMAVSSSWVLATSASADGCARVTSTMRVRLPSPSASTAPAYCARCFSSPASGPRQEASPFPVVRNPLQAPGSCRRRIVWPVGAVSKTMWSYLPATPVSVSREVNSSNAAISVVHAPESCSSMPLTTASGRTPRTGPTIRSRYLCAAASGSISSAARRGTSGIGVRRLPTVRPNTWPTFDAGSVLTSRTRAPASARWTAVAQAIDVLPTPPLPVKKTY